MEQIKKDSEYFNNLKEVKEFITECKQTTHHYHGLKIPGNEFDNWKNDKRVENKYAKWIIQDSNCPSLLLNIPVPYKEMTAEAEQFLDRFVKHRGGWNPGWSSIAVHGQSAERTQPANYYVEEGIDSEDNIKICDFGFSKKFTECEMHNTMCGSPLYMAPEIIKHKS